MRMHPLRFASVVLFLLALVGPAAAGPARRHAPRRRGAVVWKLRSSATPAALGRLAAVLGSRGASTLRRLEALGARVDTFAGDELTEEERCAELLATGAVAFAEPDYRVAPATTPDDPGYASQWQHTKIGSPSAWTTTTGSASTLVAVCDTGISSTHPDLAGNLVLPGYNAVDGSTNTEPVYNHGTGVAGCIGAVGNNATGVAGVAWRVGLLPVRITNSSDGAAYVSDAADGIRWAADQGARVVNLSFRMAGYATIDAAAQYLRGKGGLLFVAAGNDGTDPGWPDYASFLSVAATGSNDAAASWSNRGTYVDLAAPGVGVYSTSGASGYASWSGTSFASPIAAGVAALLFAYDATLSPTEVESVLLSTCVDLGATGEDDVYGNGRVDAAAAVAAVSDTTPNAAPVAVAGAGTTSGTAPVTVAFDGSASYDTDGSLVSWAWDFGDGTTGSAEQTSHTYEVAGTFEARLTVTDDRGASAQDSVTVTVSPDPSHVVYVADVTLEDETQPGGWVARARVRVVDLDGRARAGAAVTGVFTDRGVTTALGTTDGTGVATLTSKKAKAGATVAFAVQDVSLPGWTYDASRNVLASGSITVGDTGDTPPQAVAVADVTTGQAPLAVELDGGSSQDPDGTVVAWTWDLGDGSTATGAVVTHTYGSAGVYTAVLTVTDDAGATDSAEVAIDVHGDPTKVVYVQSVVVALVSAPGGAVPTATVTLATLDGGSCAGATVSGTWSGVVEETSGATAGAEGVAVLEARKTKKSGEVTLTVTGVALAGYVFDPRLGSAAGTAGASPQGR